MEDPYCIETIESIDNEIQKHAEQHEEVLRIRKNLQDRVNLVQAMIEFEKNASDPARLFRSSFRLLQEEKFRKTAYPNLLKMESSLRTIVSAYQASPFILNP